MKTTANLRIYYEDRLVIRWTDGKRSFSQGKRVGANCAMPLQFRRIYVKQGLIPVIKALKDRYGWSLAESLAFAKKAMGRP